MNLLASIFVAGALAFCADNPAAYECAALPEPTPVELTASRLERLTDIASRTRFRYEGTRSQGAERDTNKRDVWRVSRGGREGDCEDRLLWAWRHLRASDPDLGRAARPLLLLPAGRQTIRAHVVLVVHTTRGTLVLDADREGLQRLADYPGMRAYEPVEGVGGQWVRR